MTARRPRIGAHMSIAGGLVRAIDRAVAAGCETLQIFTTSSNQWRPRPLDAAEAGAFRAKAAAAGVEPIVAHASYLINVASPDPTLRARSAAALATELDRADALGLSGVVLHPGAYTTSTEAEGLDRIADSVGTILAGRTSGSARLLLEVTAGQGTVLGYRFEHFAFLLDRLDRSPDVGICLDTCHLVAAGFDVISETGYERVMATFDALVGFDRLHAMHLNDSKKALGSRLDRHEHIGRGHIGTDAFRRILRDPRLRDVPMIIETKKEDALPPTSVDVDSMDRRNLDLLRELRDHDAPTGG